MNIDRAVLALAGTLILVSVLLTVFVSTWWLLLTSFVGLNLLQSSMTGFCPAALILAKLGLAPGVTIGTSDPVDEIPLGVSSKNRHNLDGGRRG